MKRLSQILLFFFSALLFSNKSSAQNEVFIACSNKALIRANVADSTYQIIGYTFAEFEDIAYNALSGKLYGISLNTLYEIDTSNANMSYMTQTDWGFNALTCTPFGITFAMKTNGDLYTINPANGDAWFLGDPVPGSSLWSAGDISYYDGYLYYTANNNPSGGGGLVKVDINDIGNSEVTDCYSSAYGLATLGCEPTLYAFVGNSIFKYTDPGFNQLSLALQLPSGFYAQGAAQVINPPFYGEFGFENDTTYLCSIADSLFSLNIPGATYLWQNGDTSSYYLADSIETIWVEATTGECFFQDTTTIAFGQNPIYELGSDTSLCKGMELLLDASYFNSTYSWKDGSTQPTLNVTEEGVYWVDVTYGNCTLRDNIFVGYDLFDVEELPEDTEVCYEDSLVIDVATSGATYLWQDGSGESVYLIDSPGYYYVEVTLGNCDWSDKIYIDFIDCRVIIDMPNVFTPNEDAINNSYLPIYYSAIDEADLIITNRWGEVVFNTDDLSIGWDGNFQGTPCSEGVYYYSIRFTDIFGEQDQIQGFFHLIR